MIHRRHSFGICIPWTPRQLARGCMPPKGGTKKGHGFILHVLGSIDFKDLYEMALSFPGADSRGGVT